MRGERWIEEEIIKWKESELKDLEHCLPLHIIKNEKSCFGENTNGLAAQSLREEIIHGVQQVSQQKSGIDGIISV